LIRLQWRAERIAHLVDFARPFILRERRLTQHHPCRMTHQALGTGDVRAVTRWERGSLVGRSTATLAHVERGVPSHTRPAASAIPKRIGAAQIRAMSRSRMLVTFSTNSLSRSHGHRLDHVAHEAGAVPVGVIGLGNVCCVDRFDHQLVRPWRWKAQGDFPLPEAVFAKIRPSRASCQWPPESAENSTFANPTSPPKAIPRTVVVCPLQDGTVLDVGEE